MSTRIGETTFRRRGKRWNWQVPYYANGKRRFASGTEDTKDAAKKAANEARAKLVTGPAVDPNRGKLTVADYLARWLEGAEADLRESTLRGYRSNAETNVFPLVGRIRVKDLTADDARKLGDFARLGWASR
jgi:hypothetical protein